MKMLPTDKSEPKEEPKEELKEEPKKKSITAPGENITTCPDCMTMFNTTTGDIVKRKDTDQSGLTDKPKEETPLDDDTDYDDMIPPLFDKHNFKESEDKD